MKNLILIVFIFAIGLVCGLGLNQLWIDSPSSPEEKNPVSQNQSNANDTDTNSPEPPIPSGPPITSSTLYEKVLPHTSPMWLLLDFKTLSQEGKALSTLWEDEIISDIGIQFTTALMPQGVTNTISLLSQNSEQTRVFLLPPEPEEHGAPFVAAARVSESTEEEQEAVSELMASIVASYPDAASTEIIAGPATINVLSTPFGELALAAKNGIVWLTPQKDALSRLWTIPPPPSLLEESDPYPALKERFENTGVALFFNTASEEKPGLAPPGLIPLSLSNVGVEHAVFLYRFQEQSSKLTMIAKANNPPEWASNWDPVEQPIFTKADPAGMIEVTMRWPGVLSATSEIQAPTESMPPEMNRPPQSIPGNGPGSRRGDRGMGRGGERGEMMGGMGTPPPGFMNRMGPAIREQMKSKMVQSQWTILSRWFDPGSLVGFNLFGFYNNLPSMALAFPGMIPEESFLQKLKQMPFIQTSNLELALLPATRYKIGQGRIDEFLPINELLAVERDAITYIFDAEEAAKNYLGEITSDPQGADRRSAEFRNLFEKVRTPAQIRAVISKDYFLYLLNQETANLPDESQLKEQFELLISKIAPHITPLVLSAGYENEEWFMDTYAQPEISHLVDTVLLGWAIYRFMGY